MGGNSSLVQNKNSEIDALKHLTPAEWVQAKELAQGLDVRDSMAVISFGAKGQKDLSAMSDPILKAVRTKDAGAAGEVLTELLSEIKSLNAGSLAEQAETTLAKLPLVGRAFNKLDQFVGQYEKVSVKIDRTTAALETSKHTLSRDVVMLDQLYDQNSASFRQLLVYIGAGELKLDALHVEQAALAEQARTSGDMIDAQNVSDFSNALLRLERRVHDLKLSAMIALQTAPQIRLVQDGDQALIEKIQSSILTTIPLWKNQVIMAIAIFDQKKAAQLQRQVAKTTNDLMVENAEMLKASAADTTREVERGIVEIETLRTVNQKLIETIQETIDIQKQGHEKRMRVEAELKALEDELQKALIRGGG